MENQVPSKLVCVVNSQGDKLAAVISTLDIPYYNQEQSPSQRCITRLFLPLLPLEDIARELFDVLLLGDDTIQSTTQVLMAALAVANLPCNAVD
jgi:hypothetical protein